MSTTIYKNMLLLEGEDLRLRRDGFLAVDSGIIVEAGTGYTGDGIDMTGAIVFPSFVNAHTHLADHCLKDAAVGLPTAVAVSPPDGIKYRGLAALSQEELVDSLRAALREMVSCGIAACGEFREGGASGVAALWAAVTDLPIRAVCFGDATVLPADASYEGQIEAVLETAEGIGIGDIARYTDDQITQLAQRYGRSGPQLAVHTAETQDAQSACRARWGESEVARILAASPDLLIHMTCPDPSDFEAVAKAGTPIVCCSRTNALLADGLPPIDRYHTLGIPLAMGTDNMMFTSPDMFREMDWFSRSARAARRRADAIDSRSVIRYATAGGARALGLHEDLGSLEPGKAACFVALDARSINLRGTHNVHDAIVHRAGLQDIVSVVAWGSEVIDRRNR